MKLHLDRSPFTFLKVILFLLPLLAATASYSQNVKSLTILPTSVPGGVSAVGTVTISSEAPADGFVVSISSNKVEATVPASVKVLAGQTVATFSVTTVPVLSNLTATILCQGGGATVSAKLGVKAPSVLSLVITPSSVIGGKSAQGTVTLSGNTTSAGVTAALKCTSGLVTIPSSLTIGSGKSSATFNITTKTTSETTLVTVTASLNGSSRSDNISVVSLGLAALSPWPRFHGDMMSTGNAKAPVTGAAWKYKAGLRVFSSPAIGPDGSVYVGSSDGFVYAINGSTGAFKWAFQTGGKVSASPALGYDGNVYIGSTDSYMYAIDSTSGAMVWKFKTGGPIVSSVAIGSDNYIYFGSYDRKIYSLSRKTGSKHWSYLTGGAVSSSPNLSNDGILVVGSNDFKMYAIDTASITLKWTFLTEGYIESSPAIGANGFVYFGSDDGSVYAVRLANGAKAWKYQTGWSVFSSPCVGPDGTVYVGSDDGNVYSLNGSSGAFKWAYTTGDSVGSSPAISKGGRVYVGSDDGNVYSINAATGADIFKTGMGSMVESSPAICDANSVIVGTGSGNVLRDQVNFLYQSNFPAGDTSGWAAYTLAGVPITSPSADANPIMTTISPKGNRIFLGEFGTQSARLTLNNMTPGQQVTITATLFVLSSWDGNDTTSSGKDRFTITVRGLQTLLDTTFSNVSVSRQCYPGSYPSASNPFQTGASETNTLGYTYNGDSVYKLSYTFTPTTSTAEIEFAADMKDGQHTLANESWGLESVKVG